MLEIFKSQLAASKPLTDEQVCIAVELLIDGATPVAAKADFLTSLAQKGETVDEIAAFVRALREKSVRPPIDEATRARGILDVCGTGGDRMNTFNISTTVALICSAAGVPVAKHGNRAVTSKAGSADVLEALGLRVDLPPDEAACELREHNFAFFFAPDYHPAFKHIAAARKLCAERGQRTIFNFLGPLLNPARPGAQLIGVPRPELCEPLARVLQSLGTRRGMVVSGKVSGLEAVNNSQSARTRDENRNSNFLDELSTLGENTVAEFYQERCFLLSKLDASHFPRQPATPADLAGGSREANAKIVRRILRGEERGPKRDIVLLNAAAALFVAERARTLAAGWTLAADLIDSSQAWDKLNMLARV